MSATRVIVPSIHGNGRLRLAFGAAFLACGLCAITVGCSNHTHTPVYPVHGQVLLNGKPLADAIVSFHPQNAGVQDVFPTAHTDADGRFAMTSFEQGDGAPEGSYSISLVCFRSRPVRNGEGHADNVVPHRYANPESSKLTATVVSGTNDLPPLKLKSP
jgi:hypothetical protein